MHSSRQVASKNGCFTRLRKHPFCKEGHARYLVGKFHAGGKSQLERLPVFKLCLRAFFDRVDSQRNRRTRDRFARPAAASVNFRVMIFEAFPSALVYGKNLNKGRFAFEIANRPLHMRKCICKEKIKKSRNHLTSVQMISGLSLFLRYLYSSVLLFKLFNGLADQIDHFSVG